jgi:type IV secretory pathway VirB10-like protein
MFAFLGRKRMGCIQNKIEPAIFAVALSMVFVCLVASGCKKKVKPTVPAAPLESVITNRMNDPAYLDTLKKNRDEQTRVANARAGVSKQIEACKARVKASLPEQADEAALKAALAKDQEWQGLAKQADEMKEEDRQTVMSAREAARKRIEAEAQAVKAVSEGKAKAVDKAPPAP